MKRHPVRFARCGGLTGDVGNRRQGSLSLLLGFPWLLALLGVDERSGTEKAFTPQCDFILRLWQSQLVFLCINRMILLRAHSCLENLHVFWKDSPVLLFFSAVMLYLNSSIYSKLRHCKLISIFLKVTKTSTIEILGELLNYWIVLLVLRVFLEVAKHRFTSSTSQVIFTLFAFLVEERLFR